jgi:phosphatidylglycerophosphate synthase
MSRHALKDLYAGPKSEREMRTDFFVYAFYRPISFALTPAFLSIGATATNVTMLNLLLASLMPLVALLAPDQSYIGLALITFSCIVLDCVDGNIARATGSGSALGQYLDSLVGKAYYLLLVIALAIVAHSEVPQIGLGYWLAGAFAASMLKIWGREARAYCKLNFSYGEALFATARVGWQNILFSAAKLVPFGLLALGSIGMTRLLLGALLLMSLTTFLHTQRRILRQLSRATAPQNRVPAETYAAVSPPGPHGPAMGNDRAY